MRRAIVGVLAAAAAMWFPAAQAVEASSNPAKVILAAMHKAYQQVGAYTDRGEYLIKIDTPDGEITRRGVFATAFGGPGKLRYHLWHTGDDSDAGERQTTMWLDGAVAHMWTTLNSSDSDGVTRTFESPDQAYKESRFQAGGVENPVPIFLLSQESFTMAYQLKSVRLVGETEVNGVACWKLEGRFYSGGTLKVTVGKEDALLRRVETRAMPLGRISRGLYTEAEDTPFANSRWPQHASMVHTVIVFNPEANVPVAAEALTFTPPSPNAVAQVRR
ncbi:MAG: hypothetical protein ACF8QF_09515 [Phycisphaerales bacterium]